MTTLERHLQSVGMEAFVNYYDCFKKGYNKNQILTLVSENWKTEGNGLNTRIINARKIFENNLQIEALEIILESKKDEAIKQKARNIIKKELGGLHE